MSAALTSRDGEVKRAVCIAPSFNEALLTALPAYARTLRCASPRVLLDCLRHCLHVPTISPYWTCSDIHLHLEPPASPHRSESRYEAYGRAMGITAGYCRRMPATPTPGLHVILSAEPISDAFQNQ